MTLKRTSCVCFSNQLGLSLRPLDVFVSEGLQELACVLASGVLESNTPWSELFEGTSNEAPFILLAMAWHGGWFRGQSIASGSYMSVRRARPWVQNHATSMPLS